MRYVLRVLVCLRQLFRRAVVELRAVVEAGENKFPRRWAAKRLAYEPLEPRLPLSAAGLVDVGTQPVGGLSGKIVYTHGGHGITADNTGSGTWFFQRGVTFDLIEDLGNHDQMTGFADYLFRAGATVVPLRPVGHQPNEVVLDNDDVDVTFSGVWSDTSASVYFGDVGDVPSLSANSSVVETAFARYRPSLPEAGFYPIYAWTEHGADRASDQLYRVNHSGGITEVTVNHRRVGSGLVYLGTYYFDAGADGYVDISNRSNDAGSVVVADMIRFGNGVGDIDRGGGISGQLREDEAGLYWIQWHVDRSQGIPDTEYRTEIGDFAASRPAVPLYSEFMNRESDGQLSDRVQVSFHSNASSGTARGVLGLFNGNNDPTTATPNQFLLADTLARELHDDLVDQNGQYEHFWVEQTILTLDRTDLEFSEINNQSTGGEFDATIVEVAFHDNMLDAELMLDPKVRDAFSRATYQGVVKYYNAVDGGATPVVMAPPPVTGVRAVNSGAGSVTVLWTPPAPSTYGGDAATGYRIYGSTDGYGFDGGTLVPGGPATSHTLTGLDANEGVYYFKVVAVNVGGESVASEVIAATAGAGTKDVLIVNGFDRLDRTLNPQQSTPIGIVQRVRVRESNSADYAVQVAGAIETVGPGLGVDTASNEAVVAGAVSLADYEAVVWILGEESTVDDTFDGSEQSIAASYLAGGGNLFLSGADVAWDLDSQNNGRAFFNFDLHADFVADDAETYRVDGVAGSILDGLAFSFDDGTLFYDAESPDVITPLGGAITALEYDTGGAAAIQYDSSPSEAKVVMLAFPLETIVDTSQRITVLGRALDFFGLDVELIPYEVILDNDDDISIYFESGSWTTAGGTGYNGTTYRFAPAGSSASARWTFSIPFGGLAEVSVQYKAGSNRASNAVYEIDTGNGVETVSISQKVNDLEWVSLGTFDFAPGMHTVRLDALASTGGSIVIADAVRITVFPASAESGDFDTDGDVDGRDFLAWQRGFGTPSGAQAADGDSDGDGDVEADDLQVWQQQFGATTAIGASSSATTTADAESLVAVAQRIDSRVDRSLRSLHELGNPPTHPRVEVLFSDRRALGAWSQSAATSQGSELDDGRLDRSPRSAEDARDDLFADLGEGEMTSLQIRWA